VKIAISSWSLRSHVNKDFSLPELPRVVKQRYGISAVELCQMHFLRQDSSYLDEVYRSLKENNSVVVNMPVDTGNISQPDPTKRNHDIEIIKGWMRVAKCIGCPAVRVNTGGQLPGSTDFSITIDSYRTLVGFGRTLGVKVLLENHGGISANPENILRIFSGVNDDYFAFCPDFGNFTPEVRYQGLERMAPHAFIVHAKTYDFDEKGELPTFDFGRCLKIIRQTGFDGYLSVEFEGEGDQYQGVQKTIDLIKRTG